MLSVLNVLVFQLCVTINDEHNTRRGQISRRVIMRKLCFLRNIWQVQVFVMELHELWKKSFLMNINLLLAYVDCMYHNGFWRFIHSWSFSYDDEAKRGWIHKKEYGLMYTTFSWVTNALDIGICDRLIDKVKT